MPLGLDKITAQRIGARSLLLGLILGIGIWIIQTRRQPPLQDYRQALKYDVGDHKLHAFFLKKIYLIREFEIGRQLSLELTEQFPHVPLYVYLEKAFAYSNSPAQEQLKIIEFIANGLMQPKHMPVDLETRQFLNLFVMNHVREFVEETPRKRLLEKLFAPQMALFKENPKMFGIILNAQVPSTE